RGDKSLALPGGSIACHLRDPPLPCAMYLNGLATAVPPRRFTQAECWTALQQSPQFSRLSPRAHTVLRKVLSGDNGIAARHLAVAELAEAFMLTPDALHERFAHNAPALAIQA